MSNVAGAQAQAKRFAHQTSDVEDIRDNIEDLGNSVGNLATRQYERAHDTVTDGLRQTGDAIQRNPLTAIGIGLGLGFLVGLVTGGSGGQHLGARSAAHCSNRLLCSALGTAFCCQPGSGSGNGRRPVRIDRTGALKLGVLTAPA